MRKQTPLIYFHGIDRGKYLAVWPAFIIGDDPTVSNGLSLCKIHHAAFDSNFIGVSLDFKIIVREDVRWEKDGPMLKYGIQQFHDKRIILPRNRELWPDQKRLETRFKQFIKAV